MAYIVSLITAVVAHVVVFYVCKWLDSPSPKEKPGDTDSWFFFFVFAM